MISLSFTEAQLFRVLTALFGADHVVPQMSVLTVCSGNLPQSFEGSSTNIPAEGLASWAKRNKCLFTIVDHDDTPKMVIEFFSGFEESIDIVEEQHQRILAPLLQAVGIRYVTILPEEFSDILDPESSLDIVSFLKSKVELDSLSSQ